MKTKILILAALVFAGLTFTSCTKDNSLMDETSSQQTAPLKTEWTPDPGGFGSDMISNTPDPFRNFTIINYIVQHPGIVMLTVYSKGGQELVTALVDNEYQLTGLHSVKFDASELPPGKYIAELIIKYNIYLVKYREEMTKSAFLYQDNKTSVTD